MNLDIRPLTPDLWPAFENLLSEAGVTRRCWCMYGLVGAAYRKRSPDENKAAFREVVGKGPPPGLIAFDGDMAAGWCRIAPRDALPGLDLQWRLKRVDEVPVWALPCMYIRKSYRRRGVATQLIAAAMQATRQAGAPALEAYPVDADVSPSSSDCGYASTYVRAGFEEVARHAPARPIMRHGLAPVDPKQTSR